MNALIEFALKHRVLVLAAFILTLVGGLIAFQQLNIEAYPDPTPPMVDVVTQVAGLSAEEVERYITIPIETQTAGLPNLRTVRTISLYGLSDVKLQFTFDYTYEQALQQVLNRLSQLPALPNNAQPQISPVSPIGEIFRYQLKGPPGYSVLDLKTLQDWVLQRRFRAVPGVIDVTGWGGKTKVYELQVDFSKLMAYGLTLSQLLQTLNNSNINVGGSTVNIGPQVAVVRGVGLIRTMDDLNNTMLTQSGGNPVLVRDVAKVTVSNQPRLGIAGKGDEDDIVQGIVLMRRGEKSMPTIKRVIEEVERINAGNVLPPGVRIERIYDRKDLIELTTHTVLHNMVIGILLIFFLQWVFLGNLRSAIIVGATIPFALFFAVGILVIRGESANLLSVGAIDFGLIVDATVVMVEGIYRRLGQHWEEAAPRPTDPAEGALTGKLFAIFQAGSNVSRSIFFAAGIIIAAFLPLFTLSGVEGHIFGPMARTYAYALAGGLLATFTVTPALSALILPEHVKETETLAVRWLHKIYLPSLNFAVAHRVVALSAAVVLIGLSLVAVRFLGLEFLPKLEEGNLWIRATMPSTISLDEGNQYVNRMRRLIHAVPEVESVVSQHGRPDDGTDAAGFFNAEFFAPLKPTSQWRPDMHDKEDLTADLLKRLQAEFPGVEFNFSQYLQDNVAEAVSGVKGENSIKLFGNDLQTLSDTANKIKAVLSTVQGVEDLSVFTSLGQPTVQIDIDRARAARYGLTPGDINSTIQVAIGGQAAGDLFEPGSDRHFPIVVRLAPQFRQSPEAIENLAIGVQGSNGLMRIPLNEVATVKLVSGPSYIYREGQQRYLPIKFSVRDRDLGSAIQEAQKKVTEQVPLPAGSRLEWVGEFGNLQDAIARLKIVVPISLAMIALLLWINFGSVPDMLLAMSVIPMAIVGGILGLLVMGIPFSVSAAIGFIALFGISVMDGIIILTQYNQLIEAGLDRARAVVRTGELQMRPVIMTCIIAGVGLLPAAMSSGIGSQVQKPLAVVVVGGMLFAPIIILLTLPVLIGLVSRRGVKSAARSRSAPHPAE
ncbi:MAG: efflux RND transporter permease subunit [Rhizobiales bacterium]|nr:efflux RND transporter permease subunit [Hyphomicrobiales bacterium]OJY42966.1 MAG: cytochrome-c peroxidase [Rhizobiales bacterium 64-17]